MCVCVCVCVWEGFDYRLYNNRCSCFNSYMYLHNIHRISRKLVYDFHIMVIINTHLYDIVYVIVLCSASHAQGAEEATWQTC